jgi:catechol 2,3-dioxygenase-like lactoylglutathione lyase family enzyme
VYVLDQQRAFDFYTNKLGFKVVTDVPMGNDDRWLTVAPPQMPGFEITLTPVSRSFFSEETSEALKELVKKGTFGVAVLTCDDIFATYEELKAKGVEFTKEPKQEFYGKYKRVFVGWLFGRIALKSVLKEGVPLRRNTPTIPELVITGNGSIPAQKEKWIALVEEHGRRFNPEFIHPFFGKMTQDETGVMAYKHSDHHLRQFGC